MKQESYIKITEAVRKKKNGVKIVTGINRIVTIMIYVLFAVIILMSAFMQYQNNSSTCVRVVLVCSISFVAVTIFRYIIDEKRPYVVYDFTPLIVKEKEGQSMPSRHVFSAFVIAMSALYICIPLGIFMMLLAVIMAFERVICGVHFPKDVIAGAVIGIVSGIIGFYLI